MIYLRLDYTSTGAGQEKEKWQIKVNGSDATDWKTIDITITLGQDYEGLNLYLNANKTGTVYYDDIRLELVE